MEKGMVHIYTGDGKGKTTASVGLAVRAMGHGLKVAYASFFKRPGTCGYTEMDMLKNQGAAVFTFSEGMPMANPQISFNEYQLSTKSGLSELKEYLFSNSMQLLVLDEILIAVQYGYISETELTEFIQNKPAGLELVLTGRGATERIKEMADYVTFFAKEKHPFDQGVKSRAGIEY